MLHFLTQRAKTTQNISSGTSGTSADSGNKQSQIQLCAAADTLQTHLLAGPAGAGAGPLCLLSAAHTLLNADSGTGRTL